MNAFDVTIQAIFLTAELLFPLVAVIVVIRFVYRFVKRKDMSIWKKIWTFLLFGVGGAVASALIIIFGLAWVWECMK